MLRMHHPARTKAFTVCVFVTAMVRMTDGLADVFVDVSSRRRVTARVPYSTM
jgi:hypothetical protein